MEEDRFSFEDLKVWQMAIEIADELFDIADEFEKKRLFRTDDRFYFS